MSETICGKCKNPIQGKTLTALGKSWHPEHFVCQVCEKPITAVTFNEREGNPVCSECYTKKYSETCAQCSKPIVGKVVKALNKSWHEDHFVCGGPCKKPMAGTPFFEREGKAYCKADFEKLFAAKSVPKTSR